MFLQHQDILNQRLNFNSISWATILLVLICFSCKDLKDQPQEAHIEAETIIESIPTRLPGNIFAIDSMLVMIDPLSDEGFIRVFDVKNGIEVAKAGKLGQEPDEFISPGGAQIFEGQLVIFDPNLNRVGFFNIDSIARGKKSLIRIDKNENYQGLITYLKIDNELAIGADYSKMPLKLMETATGDIKEFGHYPIEDKINNAFDVFQGAVKFHADKALLAHGFYHTRHIILYEKNGQHFKVKWEKRFTDPEFAIRNGHLNWKDSQLKGFSGIAFTQDYIIALINEDVKVSEGGRDIKYLPKTIYVLDYDGNILKKYHLDIPVLRLATSLSSNTIYAVGMNPDFCLIKYDL